MVVVTIPIIGLAALMLLLNVVAPSALDVQVVKYVVQILPRVTGRVIEVPVEPNRLVRRGDVLFRIDPRPFQYEVDRLRALLASTTADVAAQRRGSARGRGADRRLAQSRARRSRARSRRLARGWRSPSCAWARRSSWRRPAPAIGSRRSAGRPDVAQQRADLGALLPQLAAAEQEVTASRAKAASVRESVGATVGRRAGRRRAGPRAAARRASGSSDETSVYAPADGYVINLQLRPGSTVSQLPMIPVMSFVEQEHVILALFGQNELHQVEPGNEAELALSTYPGRIIKAKVDSIIWAQGQGQLPLTGTLPQTGAAPLAGGTLRREARARRDATRTCSSRPARAARARSTRITSCRFTSFARCCCGSRRISTGSSSSTTSACTES